MAPQKGDDIPGNSDQNTSWAAVNYLLRTGYSWSGHELNCCFLNTGDGTFADVSYVSGLGLDDDGRGAAVIDWDGDGDLDLWLNNRSSPKLRLMRNDYRGGNPALVLRLEGRTVNRDAIGARVRVRLADGRVLLRTVRAGVNYTAQTTKDLHFGLGAGAAIAAVTVHWPDGTTQEVVGAEAGGRYRLVQGEAALRPLDRPRADQALRGGAFDGPEPTQVASTPLGVPFPLPGTLGLTDFAGERHDFAGGQPTLVNLWATWCPGCLTELGEFMEQREVLEEAGLRILACSVDDPADRDKAASLARRIGFWFPAGMADDDLPVYINAMKKAVFDRYEDVPLPSSLLLDGQGRVAHVYLGPVSPEALARDVASLEATTSPLEVLLRASAYAGGRWAHSDVWIPSQYGQQLMQLTQFLVQDGAPFLAAFYAEELLRFSAEQNAPEYWMRRVDTPVTLAGNDLVQRDPARAERVFRALLALVPDSLGGQVGLAAALLELGGTARTDEARAVFAAVRPRLREPVTVRDHVILGTTLFQLGETEEALPLLERAVQNLASSGEPEDPLLLLAYGSALTDVARPAEGLAAVRRSAELVAPNPFVESRIAVALDKLGRPEEAVEHHRRALELCGTADSPERRSLVGRTLFRLGDWQGVVSALEPLLADDPSRASDRATLGFALERLGRDAEALSQLDAALPQGGRDAQERYVLALLHARSGQLERAADELTAVVAERPDWGDAQRHLALALDRLGRLEEALAAYRVSVAARPEDLELRHRMAMALDRAGHVAEAEREYASLSPKLPEAKFRLAWMLASRADASGRDGAEAVRLAEELAALAGAAPPPTVRDLLGAAYASVGRYDDAIAQLSQALDGAAQVELPPAWREQMEARLALYRQGRPFRTAAETRDPEEAGAAAESEENG